MSDHMTVAKTILEQFGGNRSTYMIGAKNLAAINVNGGGFGMKHMKTTIDSNPANYFKVVLNGSDLYDLVMKDVTHSSCSRKILRLGSISVVGDQAVFVFLLLATRRVSRGLH